jgi:hypothetical protein
MTIILPITFVTGETAKVLLFLDHIHYVQQMEQGSIIILRDETEFNCSLPVEQVQKKIAAVSMKHFKFN